MSSPVRTCCPTTKTAVKSDYKAKGAVVYEAGPSDAKKAIIYVYDIFGYSPQALQVADILGERTGCRVVAIDYFEGQPWKIEDFPPKNDEEGAKLMEFIHKNGSYDEVIKPKTEWVIDRLKKQGVEEFGSIGFCWGAKMSLNMQKEGLVGPIACPHPSFITDDDITSPMVAPVCMLPSKDEEPFTKVEQVLKTDPAWKDVNVYQRFDNMHHGWTAARMDMNDEENKKEANCAIDIMIDFFIKAFKL